MDLKKQVTYLNIKELTPYKRNPRKNDKAVDKLSDAIGKNSFRGAIIVWENSEEIIGEKNIILAGNTRYKALKKMGEKEVPVILERFENEEEAFNFCIMDNKSNEWAEWDFGKLEEELKSLNFLEEDLKDLEEEFKMDFSEPKSEEELNSVPEVKKEAISRMGDLFLIDGRHRVLCGDSTKEEDVERLMDGKKADMVFTDPPYKMDMGAGGGCFASSAEKLKSKIDHLSHFNPEQFLNILPDIFNDCMNSYIFCSKDLVVDYLNYAKENKYSYNILVWKKPNCIPFGDTHRPDIEYLIVLRKNAIWNNGLKDVNYSRCLEFNKVVSEDHPTIKPVELVSNEILISSNKNSIITDLFLGSGTTLIACEQTGRVCYGMELEPLYIDVILRRYHKLYPDKEIQCLNREFNFEVLYG